MLYFNHLNFALLEPKCLECDRDVFKFRFEKSMRSATDMSIILGIMPVLGDQQRTWAIEAGHN